MATAPSASYSLSVRVRLPEGQYTFSPLVHTIEEAGGVISTVIDVGDNVRELVVLASSLAQEHAIAARARDAYCRRRFPHRRLHLRHA